MKSEILNSVVVTGIGLITPLGIGRERSWKNLLGGLSGIAKDEEFGGVLTARVNGLDVSDEARLLSMGFLAAAEAIHDSMLMTSIHSEERIGCTVSVSKPTLITTASGKLNSSLELLDTSTLGSQLRKVFKFTGPSRNITSACATGTNSIILGAEWIKQGLCDVVIAGAAESSLSKLYAAGFDQMGVLARQAVRPFDLNREGFAMGEGAAVLVLERKDSAEFRNAKIYGEVSGWAMANDASSQVAFEESGDAIAQAVKSSLVKAGKDTVDYINAHGTATKLNDLIESRAIRKVFGVNAGMLSVSSTKAATGHMLGAGGAAEAAFCLLAMRDRSVPPTLNLFDPDPDCGLDFTPLTARRRIINSSMSLSFGFGGQIGVIVLTV